MHASKTIIVTGVTGFVGSHFAAEALANDIGICAIVRASNASEADLRAAAAVMAAASSRLLEVSTEKLFSSIGEITEPNCGLSPLDIQRAKKAQPSEFWHFAASLNFENANREKIVSHNIGGTKNALELALVLGVRRFVYVSTAYVAGTAKGSIPEKLHEHFEFNNAYEETKAHAEHEVRRFCEANGIEWLVVRPGIVVGPSTTHETGGSTTGLYGFVKLLVGLKVSLSAENLALTILGDPSTPLHFIPVDKVVSRLMQLVNRPQDYNVHHVTSSHGVTAQEFLNIASSSVGIKDLQLVEIRDRSPSALELMMDRLMLFYGAYSRSPKEFLQRVPVAPSLTSKDVALYVDHFLQSVKTSKSSPFKRTQLQSRQGESFSAFSIIGAPTKETVILVNAFGMPKDFWEPVADSLSKEYNVLTWETRGLPDLSDKFDPEHHGILDHAEDLRGVMDHFGVPSAHVLGWCTGAQVALRSYALFPNRVRSLILLNGAYSLGADVPISDFRQNLARILPRAATSVERARAYRALLFAKGPAYSNELTSISTDDYHAVCNALSSTDEFLLDLTNRPFATDTALYRYANMITHMLAEPSHAWATGVNVPTLLITSDRDFISHPAATREIARMILNSELVQLNDADHFALYKDERVIRLIHDFLQGVSDREASQKSEELTRVA